MQFLFPTLTWGFLLVLLPLLIQLINLARQRRTSWAAMDFLLQAYRKHRTWIWLKQFLLLLLRMAAIAIAVAMLAHMVTRAEWSRFFGSRVTHHIVLLDDSYSMSETVGGVSAFDRAESVINSLARQAIDQDSLQKFTILRFSQAARGPYGEPTVARASDETVETPESAVADWIDLHAALVDSEFDKTLAPVRNGWQVTDLAEGPETAMAAAAEIVRNGTGNESAFVYVLSDFRASQWDSPAASLAAITDLEKAGAAVHLVRCVRQAQENLAITRIRPHSGPQAAGVPMFVDVTVTNFGAQPATDVPVAVHVQEFSSRQSTTPKDHGAQQESALPNLLVDSIGPGASVTRKSPSVLFHGGAARRNR